MAIDTKAERNRALNFGATGWMFRRSMPLPDGTIGVEDRAHLLALYYHEAGPTGHLSGTVSVVSRLSGTTEVVPRLQATVEIN